MILDQDAAGMRGRRHPESDRPGIAGGVFNVCVTNFTSGTVLFPLTALGNSTCAPDTQSYAALVGAACSERLHL